MQFLDVSLHYPPHFIFQVEINVVHFFFLARDCHAPSLRGQISTATAARPTWLRDRGQPAPHSLRDDREDDV